MTEKGTAYVRATGTHKGAKKYAGRAKRPAAPRYIPSVYPIKQKRRAVIAYLAGVPWDTIFMQTGVSRSTVLSWIRQDEELRRNSLFDMTIR
jgi:hypothetical protein